MTPPPAESPQAHCDVAPSHDKIGDDGFDFDGDGGEETYTTDTIPSGAASTPLEFAESVDTTAAPELDGDLSLRGRNAVVLVGMLLALSASIAVAFSYAGPRSELAKSSLGTGQQGGNGGDLRGRDGPPVISDLPPQYGSPGEVLERDGAGATNPEGDGAQGKLSGPTDDSDGEGDVGNYGPQHYSNDVGRNISRLESTLAFLSEVSSIDDLSDDQSSQGRAARWIAEEDPAWLKIPDILGRSTWEFMERYCAAVIYYSLGGPNWTDGLGFLSGEGVCYWNREINTQAGHQNNFGLRCSKAGRIIQLWTRE